MDKSADNTGKLKIQKRVIFTFLKRVIRRTKKELGIKGMEYSLVENDNSADDDDNVIVYCISNESLDQPTILEMDVERKKIRVVIYSYNQAFLKIIKEEFPIVVKKLKIDDWAIIW